MEENEQKLKINYIIEGEGAAVILLHGWGGSIATMRPISSPLMGKFIIPEMYGHGKTLHGEKPLTLDDFVNSIICLMDELKLADAIIIGHSFGGRVAIKLASLCPNRVSGLILIDSAGVRPKRKLNYYFKIWRYKLWRYLGLATDNMGSLDYKALSAVEKATFINIVNEDLTEYLRDIKADTLLIWGREDKDTPLYMAKKMLKNIPHSSLIVIEGAGHYSYIDKKSEVLLIINAYLKQFRGEK